MTSSSDDILAGLLAECSDLILAGASIETCLDRYPEHAVELRPMLSMLVRVRELRPVPARSAAAAAQSRALFMTAAVRLSDERNRSPLTVKARLAAWWSSFIALFTQPAQGWGLPRSVPMGLIATVIIVILIGTLITGGVTVSANALPGDILYLLKTSAERVQLLITSDPLQRSILQQEFAERRIDEAQVVAQQGRRVASLPLDGAIEALNGENWTVSGLHLTLTPDTQIIGMPALGARVHGVIRAPGDGRLIVIYAEVEAAPARQAPASQAPAQPTATPTARTSRPTATPTPTATAEATAGSISSAVNAPRQRWDEPGGWAPLTYTHSHSQSHARGHGYPDAQPHQYAYDSHTTPQPYAAHRRASGKTGDHAARPGLG